MLAGPTILENADDPMARTAFCDQCANRDDPDEVRAMKQALNDAISPWIERGSTEDTIPGSKQIERGRQSSVPEDQPSCRNTR